MNNTTGVVAHTNPFPGLRPFHEDEEYLFFGRESQVDAMVNKLAATRFLAVVGASGSGKSSLVNCGLRPALHGGLMAHAGTVWRTAQFRPGSDPLGSMAHALAVDGVLFHDYQAGGLTLTEIIDTTLRMSTLGLIDIYEQAQLDEDANLLVVVDQFEELFRYRQLEDGKDEKLSDIGEHATAFVNLLLAAREQTVRPIYVVLTMRSDFLGDCAEFAGLAEAINAGQYLVPRMTREQRRMAIAGPVGVRGTEISPVLLTRLVNDVGDNPDQLSILQHALNRTWACWENDGAGGPLDLAHYESIGTMAHALDKHAEKAYAELATTRRQHICEKLFKALTDKATDVRGTRRPTRLDTLCALADADVAEISQVMDVFRKPSRSFLTPPAEQVLKASTVIDISHESLMRVWRRLNTWADEEARSAQMYRRLAETAALNATGKVGLLRDPELELALQWKEQDRPNAVWAERYAPDFDSTMGFLDRSEQQRDAEREAELQRAQTEEAAERERLQSEAERRHLKAEAQTQRRLTRITRVAAVVLSAVTAVALYFWNDAANERDMAEIARAEAQKASTEAQTQQKMAEKASAEARKQQDIAEKARDEAEHQRSLSEVRFNALIDARAEANRAEVERERLRKVAGGLLAEAAQAETGREQAEIEREQLRKVAGALLDEISSLQKTKAE